MQKFKLIDIGNSFKDPKLAHKNIYRDEAIEDV